MPEEAITWEQHNEQKRYYRYLEEMNGIHPPYAEPRPLLIYLRNTSAIIPLEPVICQADQRLQLSITFLQPPRVTIGRTQNVQTFTETDQEMSEIS